MSKLGKALEDFKNRVDVHNAYLSNTSEVEDPDAFRNVGYDNAFSMTEFKKNFKISILENTSDTLIFQMNGIGAPIANAMRRILISDVPTMAIDTVLLIQNTSIMQDEVLSHRLGLIPIDADPELFRDYHDGQQLNDNNATVFVLDVTCTENPDSKPTDPIDVRFKNSIIYSRDLKWVPQGDQAERFKNNPIKPVYGDIPILKLRPGQSVQAELHVVKGTGRQHAKWSPVATAFYRQMPAVTFTEELTDDEAVRFVESFPTNVFALEDIPNSKKGSKTTKKIVVKDIKNYPMCRECIRDPELEKKVRLQRVRDQYIFTIESAGQLLPTIIFKRALAIFKMKLGTLYHAVKEAQSEL